MHRVEEGKQKAFEDCFLVCSVSHKICPTQPALQIKDSGGKEGICIGGLFSRLYVEQLIWCFPLR